MVSPRALATTMMVSGCGSGVANGDVLRTEEPSNSKAGWPLTAFGRKIGMRWLYVATCPWPVRSAALLTSRSSPDGTRSTEVSLAWSQSLLAASMASHSRSCVIHEPRSRWRSSVACIRRMSSTSVRWAASCAGARIAWQTCERVARSLALKVLRMHSITRPSRYTSVPEWSVSCISTGADQVEDCSRISGENGSFGGDEQSV